MHKGRRERKGEEQEKKKRDNFSSDFKGLNKAFLGKGKEDLELSLDLPKMPQDAPRGSKLSLKQAL